MMQNPLKKICMQTHIDPKKGNQLDALPAIQQYLMDINNTAQGLMFKSMSEGTVKVNEK